MIARAWRYFEGISDRDVMLILIGFFLGAVGVSVSAHFLSREVNLWAWLDSFTQNFGTEMFGGFLTFLLFEVVRGSRREREVAEQEADELKRELIRKMGSDVRDIAVPAVEELREHGWLRDGSLKGVRLSSANLQGVYLGEANLQGAYLFGANLQEASLFDANLKGVHLSSASLQGTRLRGANLQGASLGEANLQGASLDYANLQGVYLWRANLQGASLFDANLKGVRLWEANLDGADLSRADLQGAKLGRANLQGARLRGANLQGANLQGAVFDGETTLPDRTRWTPDADLARFTDLKRSDFWRSDEPGSPAYRGDSEEAPDA